MSKAKEFHIGDRVAYAARFLKSTGQITGEAPFRRGTVCAVKSISDYDLLTVDWDDRIAARPVLASNLTLVSRIAEDAALA